jgi:energy-coupling factor transporter ATP-binding protein EcfA2
MYIFAANIKNFRSCADLWFFPNPDVNVIVGPNNCGKSTILRALSYVLDPSINYRQPNLITKFDFNYSKIAQPIELTVWIKPAMHPDEHGNAIFDDSDSLKKVFFDKFSNWILQTSEVDITGRTEVHPMKVTPLIIEPMTRPEDIPAHERLLAIRLRSTWNESIESTETEVEIIDEVGDRLAPLSNQHKDLLGFKMVGGRRNPLYELSLSRQSVLSNMIDDGEVNLALRELLKQLDSGKNQLLDKPSINGLMQRLSKLIAPELIGSLLNNLGTEFSLTFLGSDLWRLRGATSIATNIAIDRENKFSLPLEYQGDGAQNLILIAHLIDIIREPKDNDIIVIEEPEQNLEPSLARWIFGELCSLTQKKMKHVGQLFITTHSPALVNELKGAETLFIFSDNPLAIQGAGASTSREWHIIPARVLPPDTRKRLDQHRERYIPALFARQTLLVEGSSEIGFLPVAFRYFSEGQPGQNPYHLGLEIANGEDKSKMVIHASYLRSYGKKCHLLFDHDGDDTAEVKTQRISRFNGKVEFVTCWPDINPLPFTTGCDLEVILAHYVSPSILFEAIKVAYEDAGHPFLEQDWRKACSLVNDPTISSRFPNVFGDFNLKTYSLNGLIDETAQRAFLFALLHGPHECKATKDMRMIAEFLVDKNEVPELFNDLRKKILLSMTNPERIDHNAPYLAPR